MNSDTPCPNCDCVQTGPFCAGCGQRRRGRLSTRELGVDLLSHVFSVDSAVSRTVGGMVRNPGHVAREYVAGRRARYVNPIRYCLLILALYLLIGLLLGVDPTKAIGDMAITGTTAEAAEAARAKIARNVDLVLILALPLFALLLRGYYRKAGYNYAEIVTFTLLVVGQSFLYATLLLPLSLWWPGLTVGLRVVIQSVLFAWAAFVFFGGTGARGAIKAMGVQVLYISSILPVALTAVLWALFRTAP